MALRWFLNVSVSGKDSSPDLVANLGVDWDPPACSHIQGDVTAERQPFVVGVVLKSCGLGRGHHGERCIHAVNCGN